MNRELDKTVVTLGDAFAAEAVYLARRRSSTIGWLVPLHVNIAHAIARSNAAGSRFERRELPLPRQPVPQPAAEADTPSPWIMQVDRPPNAAMPTTTGDDAQARRREAYFEPRSEPKDHQEIIARITPRRQTRFEDTGQPNRVEKVSPLSRPLRRPSGREPGTTGIEAALGTVSRRPSPGPARIRAISPAPIAHDDSAADPVSASKMNRTMALPVEARHKLHEVIGPEITALRPHHDRRSDVIARKHHAAAVTIGRDVFFRKDAYKPHEPEGLALLAHEATHVAEGMRPSAAWRRVTEGGVRQEETLAHARERAFLPAHRAIAPPVASRASIAAPVRAGNAAAEPSARPMAADINRAETAGGAPQQTRMPDFDEMRKVLFRDLMARIKVEFERGA